jgi:hypothetical protein
MTALSLQHGSALMIIDLAVLPKFRPNASPKTHHLRPVTIWYVTQ